MAIAYKLTCQVFKLDGYREVAPSQQEMDAFADSILNLIKLFNMHGSVTYRPIDQRDDPFAPY